MSKIKTDILQSFSGGSINVLSQMTGSITASYINASNVDGSVPTSSLALTSSVSINQNASSGSLSFWQGSQSEYNLISASADPNTVYFIRS